MGDLRDDCQYVLAMVWKDEVDDTDSTFVFLGKLARHEISSPESVTRAWRKVLEERPDLRGKKYEHRHRIVEPEFKQAIKEVAKAIKPQQSFI